MALNTDKNSYTVLFSVIMVSVVGAILAYLATGLKDKITENQRFEKQQNILYAMGVHNNTDESSVNFIPTTEVDQRFGELIKGQYVIQDGEATPQEDAFMIDLKKELDLIKSGKDGKLPLFIGEQEGKTYYIFPMYGKGLWDAIWGYMSVDESLTITGVYFDHKGETPGLGANIKMRFFMDDFIGESIVSDTGYTPIEVVKGNNDPLNSDKSDAQVDALAGATITGNGVSAMIKESIRLYEPYFEKVRSLN
ncbi:MAG: Na(+)-translocating NADH-quinone reductase subunit C [Flavobacteriaceae bacterium]|jgi:Na+-transporting NADH:ubiquinone oxidoreductase subunit C